MLSKPFSGKELYVEYEKQMRGPNIDHADDWDNSIGKTKKQAWNNLAKLINNRMDEEVIESRIKGNSSD